MIKSFIHTQTFWLHSHRPLNTCHCPQIYAFFFKLSYINTHIHMHSYIITCVWIYTICNKYGLLSNWKQIVNKNSKILKKFVHIFIFENQKKGYSIMNYCLYDALDGLSKATLCSHQVVLIHVDHHIDDGGLRSNSLLLWGPMDWFPFSYWQEHSNKESYECSKLVMTWLWKFLANNFGIR